MTMFILARKRPADTQPSRDAASWLGLAASPTFALMAWFSANDMQAMMCSSGPGILPIGGMAWMYLLMSFFHLSPWLKLASALSRQLARPIVRQEAIGGNYGGAN
ncbi:hypothetical protein [Shumkonia mesophila]|uniref:hypothetical protein n=1 Tax=Shumkonia mesophila TaxID=2838854 RepID=UPI0029342A9B|nr:hypothetical protein [Shumkonia mesophila]